MYLFFKKLFLIVLIGIFFSVFFHDAKAFWPDPCQLTPEKNCEIILGYLRDPLIGRSMIDEGRGAWNRNALLKMRKKYREYLGIYDGLYGHSVSKKFFSFENFIEDFYSMRIGDRGNDDPAIAHFLRLVEGGYNLVDNHSNRWAALDIYEQFSQIPGPEYILKAVEFLKEAKPITRDGIEDALGFAIFPVYEVVQEVFPDLGVGDVQNNLGAPALLENLIVENVELNHGDCWETAQNYFKSLSYSNLVNDLDSFSRNNMDRNFSRAIHDLLGNDGPREDRSLEEWLTDLRGKAPYTFQIERNVRAARVSESFPNLEKERCGSIFEKHLKGTPLLKALVSTIGPIDFLEQDITEKVAKNIMSEKLDLEAALEATEISIATKLLKEKVPALEEGDFEECLSKILLDRKDLNEALDEVLEGR